MQCDVRPMPKDEIIKIMRKVYKKSYTSTTDCKFSDGEWFMQIKSPLEIFGGWRFDSHGRFDSQLVKIGSEVRQVSYEDLGIKNPNPNDTSSYSKPALSVWIDYYPPNGGRIRFDAAMALIRFIPGSEHTAKLEYEINPDPEVREFFTLYNKLLIAHAGMGKNRISFFEKL